MTRLIRLPRFIVGLIGILAVTTSAAVGQDPIGGPYEADSATVLLMHFDGDLSEASDVSEDGVANGTIGFGVDPRLSHLGQQIRIDNSSRADSTYITVADNDALDLTGSWTIELWVNVFTFGDTADDWRWEPRIMFKPGEDVFNQSNYFYNLRGSIRDFRTGYWTPSGDQWEEVESRAGLMEPGQWYHITFIRDTTKQVIAQLIHQLDDEGNMVMTSFGSKSYDPVTGDPPMVNDNPVYIGSFPEQPNFFLDGFMDEIRISNVVRNFAIPPVITNLSQIENQPAGEPAEIEVDIDVIGSATIEDATVHYRIDQGPWQEAALAVRDGSTYAAQIPGQSFGTVVDYYVSAETSTGMRTTLPATAEDDENPIHRTFGFWTPETQTLDLGFDGPDAPLADVSDYGHEVVLHGDLQLEEGVGGEGNSIFLDGETNFLEIESPFLASSQFTVDFWFMAADSLPHGGTRLVIKENRTVVGNNWDWVTYQIWTPGGGTIIPATYVVPDRGFIGGPMRFDSTIVADEWYRVLYVMEQDTAWAQLRDVNNEIVTESGTSIAGQTGANLADGPFRIGNSTQNVFFRGLIDSVRVYNYAKTDEKTSTARDYGDELPQKIVLRQNYPNPFNPATTIDYALPQAADVSLVVYDVLGREIMQLVDGHMPAGEHHAVLDGSGLASGIYFYQLRTETGATTKKMMLVK